MTAGNNEQPIVDIAGFPICWLDGPRLQRHLLEKAQKRAQCTLLFVNSNFVNQCDGFREPLHDEDVCLVNDGVAMDLASRLVYGRPFPDNLNGTDLVPTLLANVAEQQGECRVFLLGGAPGVARRAGEALAERGVTPVGALDGFTEAADDKGVISRINASGADVLLVAMGNPRQEAWLLEHRHRLQPRLLIGVGALLDFLAGKKPRAPQWIRRLRLEWLHRLALEPRRLLRRYTVEMAMFLMTVWRHRHRAFQGMGH